MIAIGCENISLSFAVTQILNNVTFSINEGERLGIVGINGAGKTTLIKILSGELSPDDGNVYISKKLSVGVLKQHIEYESDKNVYDALVQEFKPSNPNDANSTEKEKGEYISRVKGFLKNLGFSENEITNFPVSSLSGGQKTRIALASILLKNYDVLLLDEPTNHLDMSSLLWLEEHLKNSGKTIVIISHDRYFLDKVTTRTLEIENTVAKLYNGNYSFYSAQKKKDREVQEKHYKDQQKEIARIEAYIAKQRQWNRERNIIAAESREKQLKKLERVEKVSALPEKLKLSFDSGTRSGDDVLSIRKVSKKYDNHILFSDVSFEVKLREKAFIFGNNGCGKSTLLKIIAGRIPADNGVIDVGYNVRVGYYDQENQDLTYSNTVMEELWQLNETLSPGEIRNILVKFLFFGDDCFKNVQDLSGGEKARLTLAKLLMSQNNLLILDEPTNHLDIDSREALEDALMSYEGTLLAVSHDRYFIDKLSSRMLVFGATEQGKIFDYKGSFSEYLKYKEEYLTSAHEQSEQKKETASKTEFQRKKEELSNIRKFAHKIEVAKKEVIRIEQRISEIDEESNGDAATDHKKLSELYEERVELEAKLLEHYEFLMENNVEI